MVRIAIALASALVGLTLAPVPAAAQAAPDASCPGPRTSYFGVGGGTATAQTFTTQASGNLTSVQIQGYRDVTSAVHDVVMQINSVDGSGTPTDTALATTVFPAQAISSDSDNPSPLTAQFASPAVVTAGERYALVVLTHDDDDLQAEFQVNGPCPGAMFAKFDPADPWSEPSSCAPCDLLFATFVEPPPEPVDSEAPTAAITSGPPDKTRKKTATFAFTGTDTRALASFQCSLDGAAFATCTSPFTVRVKKGKHTFQVRAVDQAGNVGTPASDDWKRKKKKRR